MSFIQFSCCCTCSTSKTFHVTGCASAALSGATVALDDGAGHTYSGTTDGSGNVTFTITFAAVYAYTVSKTGYTAATGTVTIVCNTSPATTNVALSAGTGYSCVVDPCCPQGGSAPFPVLTYPTTLTLNDGFGNVTLTKSGSVWSGSATRTASVAYSLGAFPCDTAINQTVNAYFELVCTGGTWVLSFNYDGCSASGCRASFPSNDNICGPVNGGGAFLTASACPPALALSGTVTGMVGCPTAGCVAAYQVYGSTASVTVA